MTSLPVKNDGVRGASCIIVQVSVNVCPFLFFVPMTECVSAMGQAPFTVFRTSKQLSLRLRSWWTSAVVGLSLSLFSPTLPISLFFQPMRHGMTASHPHARLERTSQSYSRTCRLE